MTTKIKKQKSAGVEPVEVRVEPPSLSLEDRVKIFVGDVPLLHKIDIHQIKFDNYRVNVWTKRYSSCSIVPSNKIEHSYFLCITEDSITDLTLRK